MSIFWDYHGRCEFLLQISHNSIHRLGIVDSQVVLLLWQLIGSIQVDPEPVKEIEMFAHNERQEYERSFESCGAHGCTCFFMK